MLVLRCCECVCCMWSFGSKVRPRTFGYVAMGSALLYIFRSRLLVYSAGSGVNRVQVVLSVFSMRLYCFVQAKIFCMYGSIHFLAAMNLIVVPGMLVYSSCLISVCMFIVSKSLLISSATVIVRAGETFWLNPFTPVLFSVCSAVTVGCCVLYPCCVGVFGMFAVM